jgi:hypothetical protein
MTANPKRPLEQRQQPEEFPASAAYQELARTADEEFREWIRRRARRRAERRRAQRVLKCDAEFSE